jgi:hypothetical protein
MRQSSANLLWPAIELGSISFRETLMKKCPSAVSMVVGLMLVGSALTSAQVDAQQSQQPVIYLNHAWSQPDGEWYHQFSQGATAGFTYTVAMEPRMPVCLGDALARVYFGSMCRNASEGLARYVAHAPVQQSRLNVT